MERNTPAAPLPQHSPDLYLMDGGLETTLVFLEGVELRDFAAFELLDSETGHARLEDYYQRHARIAREQGLGFIFESPTWRASRDWGARLGYGPEALRSLNQRGIDLARRLRDSHKAAGLPALAAGCLGPRGDGYAPAEVMTADEAERYHRPQIQAFADADAEMMTAMTLTYQAEAIGVLRAAQAAGLAAAISFTVETDGKLPSGQPLGRAIESVDTATDGAAAYFMINCAHPTHFQEALRAAGPWALRLRGLRANASRLSHAELDAAENLDDGNPREFGREYRDLQQSLPQLVVFGGCCGTDHRHIEAVAAACKHAA